VNLPNKLTVLRILLVPFLIFFLLTDVVPFSYIFAMLIFIAASLTDLFDGRYARKHNMITDFGKFADPLADKILVISAYCCFVDMGIISCVPVIIILFREFAVTSVRLVAASKGKVVAANIWGKAKTVSQIVVVILVILLLIVSRFINNEAVSSVFYIIDNAAVWISVLFTVFSGVIYLKDNSDIYTTMK